MNFNTTHQPDYDLTSLLTEEVINLYGVGVKYIVTDKVSLDESVFGEWMTLKADNNDVFNEIYLLPEDTARFQGDGGILFDNFGLSNYETVEFFMHKNTFSRIFGQELETNSSLNDMVADLVILPSGKVLEITHVDPKPEGLNNLWAYNDKKNVIKLILRNYQFNKNDEIGENILPTLSPDEASTYNNLTDYFDKLLTEDKVPDENYKNDRNNSVERTHYQFSHSDSLQVVDKLLINNTIAGEDVIKNIPEKGITEGARSDKDVQDVQSVYDVVEKEDEYSSPFGELG